MPSIFKIILVKSYRKHGFDHWVRSSLGGGNGNPLQYSCLENPMDSETWQAIKSIGLQRVGHN